MRRLKPVPHFFKTPHKTKAKSESRHLASYHPNRVGDDVRRLKPVPFDRPPSLPPGEGRVRGHSADATVSHCELA